MRLFRTNTPAPMAALIVVAALLLASGCSKKSSSTAPVGSVSEPFDSGAIGNGGVFAHTFPNAGTFTYHCSIHTSMTASIVVSASSPNANAAVSIVGFAFGPNPQTVKPGGTVTWTNNDPTNHTVTRP